MRPGAQCIVQTPEALRSCMRTARVSAPKEVKHYLRKPHRVGVYVALATYPILRRADGIYMISRWTGTPLSRPHCILACATHIGTGRQQEPRAVE